ncbi:unnamed protein product [Mycena citricolor]|uniref:Uncharacterized protein n=1 Tax=Mycena citricolor TaxID=2018698 RepID=A0AAD2HK09_9AGAR|nr:unnamed protein product [Mycena citricolor]
MHLYFAPASHCTRGQRDRSQTFRQLMRLTGKVLGLPRRAPGAVHLTQREQCRQKTLRDTKLGNACNPPRFGRGARSRSGERIIVGS